MPNLVPSVLACGALLMASAAHAQAPAGGPVIVKPAQSILAPEKNLPTDVSPLSVRAPTETIQKQAHDFVQLVSAASPAIDQLARWHTAICISVAGLPDDQAARVSARIKEVGQSLGLRTLPPGCKANIEVVFTEQPQVFMDKVAATKEQNLGYYHRHDKDKLKTVTRPIQAWYMTATNSGAPAGAAALAFITTDTTGGNTSSAEAKVEGAPVAITAMSGVQKHSSTDDDPDETPPTGCAEAPAFTHCLLSELTNALIVVDPTRLKSGQTLGPITDYLSLLALAQIKSLDGCAALPSVLDLLGRSCIGRETPDGLTPADAAYLTALYQSDLEANKPLEVDEIAARMNGLLVPRTTVAGR